MKIGELAERTGLATSRIRFYERIGLLQLVQRQPNGYRSYPPEAIQVLEIIKSAQEAGFSLDEMRTLMPGNLEAWDHAALHTALCNKIKDLDGLQKRLAQSKSRLQDLLNAIEAKPDDIACADNARRVMAEMGLGPDKGAAG